MTPNVPKLQIAHVGLSSTHERHAFETVETIPVETPRAGPTAATAEDAPTHDDTTNQNNVLRTGRPTNDRQSDDRPADVSRAD